MAAVEVAVEAAEAGEARVEDAPVTGRKKEVAAGLGAAAAEMAAGEAGMAVVALADAEGETISAPTSKMTSLVATLGKSAGTLSHSLLSRKTSMFRTQTSNHAVKLK